MPTNYERVKEFHKAYGAPAPTSPQALHVGRLILRRNLIKEEYEEWLSAVITDDFVEQVDALVDLLYVTYGTLIEMGVDADAVFAEVHRSNMSKLGADGKPIYRESDNKVLKGPNYSPPDLVSVLDASFEVES